MSRGHQLSVGRRRGSTSAIDGSDVVKVFAVLTAVGFVISLVIALVLLVLFAAVLALLVWGGVVLVRYVRSLAQRSAQAPLVVRETDDDVPVHSLSSVLATLPPHLRGDFAPPAAPTSPGPA
jgi:hypothetical protein